VCVKNKKYFSIGRLIDWSVLSLCSHEEGVSLQNTVILKKHRWESHTDDCICLLPHKLEFIGIRVSPIGLKIGNTIFLSHLYKDLCYS
jgi:hypothetical protein